MGRRVKAPAQVPAQVLVRVQALVAASKPALPETPKARKPLAREKVLAALRKLHPMD